MTHVTFTFESAADVTISVQPSESILESARKANVAIDAPCNGNGSCKKCKVELNGAEVLACLTSVGAEPITVRVPDIAAAFKSRMKTADLSDERELSLFRETQANLTEFGRDERVGLGLAIDIGTTSVAAAMVDLASGEVVAKASAGNAQIRYGADVIHRIVEAEKPGGLATLNRAIVQDTLVPLIAAMTDEPQRIVRAVVAGNTTMNHIFANVPPDSIRLEPYVPVCYDFEPMRADALGLPIAPDAEVLIAPNAGSYVGGDISAGTLASLLWRREGDYALFCDFGTNGELVFGNSEFMFTCACSAGPALEGGEMSCGMRATDGAIEACAIDRETLEPTLTVIGGGKPVGICGSGIIDSIAEMLRSGILDSRGKIAADGYRVKTSDIDGVKRYVLAFDWESATGREIAISEIDADNFMRAKGAIFSAIRTMLNAVDFTVDSISEVLVAGGIGSAINFENAVYVGMLPDIDRAKFRYIGNTSLAGAYAMLLSDAAAAKVTELKDGMTYLELSSEPGYMDEFVAACFFPHTDSNLFPSVT
ncbi:MAG: ASKHA domain-containing protein [Oscillospiraceae bacterium]|jgi:uncharacterized 2Fe-2S/4Fe-4S cluster protein (DUF4445 family)|nr:ASKHA domain-containing protein [Oscillospiraceae bacterium]